MSTMKYCCKCDNILYPKEDKDQKILLYACRNCNHQEAADDNCVYRIEIEHAEEECPLPRTKSVCCSECGHGEAVFFQDIAPGEEGMALFFKCCNPSCAHPWRD